MTTKEAAAVLGVSVARPMPVKPKSAKDTKPRKKRTDAPVKPLEAFARDEGRTVHVRINGMISPESDARMQREGRGLSGPERLDKCMKRLIALESVELDTMI